MDNYSSVYSNQKDPERDNIPRKKKENGKKVDKVKDPSKSTKRTFIILLVIFGMFIAFALGFFLAERGFTI